MNSEKRTKIAVSALIRRPGDEASFLSILRPASDTEIGGMWGLPAVSAWSDELPTGDTPDEMVRRVGTEKLAATIEPRQLLGVKADEREGYNLILMLVEAKLTGSEPDLGNAPTSSTRYDDWQWTTDATILTPIAKKGSLCTQIFLERSNINWKEE